MQTKLDKAFKIIVDISNRKVTIPQAISWYVTDENIAHLNCQIIDEVEDSIIDIQSYKLSMRVLTPSRILKEVNYTLSDATNNIFTLTLPDELITEKGRHQCELNIEYLGDKLTSEPFNYNIIQSIANQLDSTISKDSHYPLVLELEDKLKEWNNILDEQVSKVIILDNDVRNAEKTRQANEAQRIEAENTRSEFYEGFNDRLDTAESQLTHSDNRVDELEKMIGNGVTDEQLQRAIQTKIDDGSISSLSVGNNAIQSDNIKVDSVTYDKTDFITTGKNLFNKNTITNGVYLSPTNGGIGTHNSTCITDFIKCEPRTKYTKNDRTTNYIGCVCFYNENKEFISSVENLNTFETPPLCRYFKTTIWKTVHPLNKYQIEKGEETTVYEKYYNTFLNQYPYLKEKYCVLYNGEIVIDVENRCVNTHSVSLVTDLQQNETVYGFMPYNLDDSTIDLSSFISSRQFLYNVIFRSVEHIIDVVPYTHSMTKDDYIIATFNINNKELSSICNDFIRFKHPKTTKNDDTTLTLKVKKDGTGDYSNIRQCFDYIETMQGRYEKFIVEIYEGTYNIREYYNDDEWNNNGISVGHSVYYGLTVPNNTHVLGVGNVDKIIIAGSSSTYNTIKSTLNFKDSASIENITVKGEKLRYVVHDDMAWNGKRYERYCKNCKFIGKDLAYRQAYGSGHYGNAYWKFENCLFEVNNEYPPFACHDTAQTTYSSNIEFENCTFKSLSEQGILFNSFTPNNALTYVNIKGCNLKGIELGEIDGHSGISFRVKGYGNTKLNNVINNTDGKEYTIDII